MKTLLFILSLFLVLGNALAEEFSQPTPQDVQAISQAVVNGNHKSQLLLWDKYKHIDAYLAVLVYEEIRYTLFVSNATGLPDSTNRDWLAIWTRPNGTTEDKFLSTWSDTDFDGQINFGINDQFFYLPDRPAGWAGVDDKKENRQYFQDFHHQAIAKLKEFYGL